MQNFICTTCGTQYEAVNNEPEQCMICTDERQYVLPSGQKWTTLNDMQTEKIWRNDIKQKSERIVSITTTPKFAIGQTAYYIQTKELNILWDCITYLDSPTIAKLKQRGGIDLIAISHPHYYSTMNTWARMFDAPIYLHEHDAKWIAESSDYIQTWSGDTLQLTEDVSLHCLGGHFSGGTVLHWNKENGTLFSGDIIQILPDLQWVSFMYSYPNLIPLPAKKVKQIANDVRTIPFKTMYGAFNRVITHDANDIVQRSANRYIQALNGSLFST